MSLFIYLFCILGKWKKQNKRVSETFVLIILLLFVPTPKPNCNILILKPKIWELFEEIPEWKWCPILSVYDISMFGFGPVGMISYGYDFYD